MVHSKPAPRRSLRRSAITKPSPTSAKETEHAHSENDKHEPEQEKGKAQSHQHEDEHEPAELSNATPETVSALFVGLKSRVATL